MSKKKPPAVDDGTPKPPTLGEKAVKALAERPEDRTWRTMFPCGHDPWMSDEEYLRGTCPTCDSANELLRKLPSWFDENR
jgi:hypothetical protein